MEARRHRLPVVVLAGGVSRRFQGDKLRARLRGQAVLARTVERVRPLASQVILATPSVGRGEVLARLLDGPVRIAVDRAPRWGRGPGAAIASVLSAIPSRPLLVVPGDVPWLDPAALGRFVDRASQLGVDVAVPYWDSGATEHLVQWHRTRAVVRRLPWDPSASALPRRASELLRAAPRTGLVPVRTVSDAPGSFAHVTFRADLEDPSPRGTVHAAVRDRVVAGGVKLDYLRACRARARGDGETAGGAFLHEAGWYARAGWPFLARHALDDARGCIPHDARVERLRARLGSVDPSGRRRG
jgi:molybdopterin-guanine dinucleotide biosynthesis protein A